MCVCVCVCVCVCRMERSDLIQEPIIRSGLGGVRVEAGEDYGITEGEMQNEMATLQLARLNTTPIKTMVSQ